MKNILGIKQFKFSIDLNFEFKKEIGQNFFWKKLFKKFDLGI